MGGLQALHGGTLRGRHHHHRAFEALLADVVLDELAHLAAAFADQREHVDVGVGVAQQHRQQRALAAARRREDAHALAFAAREQAVEDPEPQAKGRVDDLTPHRVRRIREHRIPFGELKALAVERLPESVQHLAEEGGSDPDAVVLPRRRHRRIRRDAERRPERCEQDVAAVEAHHLRQRGCPGVAAGVRLQPAKLPDPHAPHEGADHRPGDAHDTPAPTDQRRGAHGVGHPVGNPVRAALRRQACRVAAAPSGFPPAVAGPFYSVMRPSGCTVTSWTSSWNDSTARSYSSVSSILRT